VKRRLFGIIGALVLALVGTFVLVSYVNGAEDRALEGEKTVKVLVAAEPIAAGTSAAGLEGKVTFERVPQKVKAEGAVTSISQLGKRVTETELMPGEQILHGRFVKPSEVESDVPGSQGDDALLETTIAVDPERAVGGKVKTGDTVAVVASFDPFDTPGGTKTPNQTHILAHKVRVTKVQIDADVASDGGSENEDDDDGAEQAPQGGLLVSLELSAADVERVVFTAEFGHVWLAAEPENADESGTKIVVLDNVFT
jgi:pilus assembly protein CpaB